MAISPASQDRPRSSSPSPAHSACVSRVRLGKSAENRTDFLSLPSSLSERLGRIHAPVLPHCFAERHGPAAGHATWTLPTDLRWPVRRGGWLTLHAVFLARAPATPSATLPPALVLPAPIRERHQAPRLPPSFGWSALHQIAG